MHKKIKFSCKFALFGLVKHASLNVHFAIILRVLMTYDFRKAKILVVDDMQPMLTLVGSLLQIMGFSNVTLCQDAEEGWQKFCELGHDIVLTDWLMEPYDGIELTQKIRTDPESPNRFVPIIMMSGYSHKIRVIKSRDVGVTEFLVKPFRARDLYARLEQLIEKPRKFVDSDEFFGPDRRRRKPSEFQGPFRREVDEFEQTCDEEQGRATELLRDVQSQIKSSTNILGEEGPDE